MAQVYDPTLSDLLELYKLDTMNDLNCHAIATVESYDLSSKTCKATLVYKKTVSERQPSGIYADVLKDYPILIDCPVINHGGGTTGIRFPIKQGDICLVCFNDRDIDNWFNGAVSKGAVASARNHAFTDGIVIVGLFAKNGSKTDYNANKADYDAGKTFWFNGTAKISLSGTDIIIQKGTVKITVGAKVKIENPAGSLMPTLLTLINDLKQLPGTYTTTTPGNPIAPSGVTALILADIETNLLKLQGLLE